MNQLIMLEKVLLKKNPVSDLKKESQMKVSEYL